MVAQPDTLRKGQKQPFPNRKLLLLSLIGITALWFGIPKWEEVVKENEEGKFVLQDWRRDDPEVEISPKKV